MEHLDSNALIFTILSFFTIFIGSVGLGSLIGAATALMTKFTLVKDLPLLETSLFFLMSYRYLPVQSLLDNLPNYLVDTFWYWDYTYFYLQLLLNSRNLSNVWNSFCLILWYFPSPLHISKSFCAITTENQTIIWNSKLFEWEFYIFLFGSIHVYLWTSLLQCYIHPWRLCGYCCSKSNAYLPVVIFTQFGKSSKNPL